MMRAMKEWFNVILVLELMHLTSDFAFTSRLFIRKKFNEIMNAKIAENLSIEV